MLNEKPVETTVYSLDRKAPEPAQRRMGERYVSLLRVGSIMIGERRELCLIRNISAAGMMIRTYAAIAPGTRVSIELKHGKPVAGTIRWTKDDYVGVNFDEPIDVIDLITTAVDGPRPRMPRVEINCIASVREDGTVHRTRAVDVSQGGLKVLSETRLSLGADVVATLSGLPPAAGVVRWKDGDCYGITFNRPLALPMLVAWLQLQQERIRATG